MGRRRVVNVEDPFTLQPVDMRRAFFLKGEAGVWYALCPANFSKCIHATGDATCPYTRRRLSEAELVRLDAQLGHSVARSCWLAALRGSARRRACSWGDAFIGFRFALADAFDAGQTSAQALLYLHAAVENLCRRFGHARVAAALDYLRDEEERRSLDAAPSAQLCRHLLRAAEEFGERGAVTPA